MRLPEPTHWVNAVECPRCEGIFNADSVSNECPACGYFMLLKCPEPREDDMEEI